MANLKSEESLGRSLGFFSTFAIGTGTMIGAGIFVLPGIASAAAGPAAIISFILGGLISMATALSMAELATGMPKAGGSYYFISRAMGPLFGTIIGLGAWFALVFKGSFALVGLAEYLHILLPIPILVTAVGAGILLLVVNYRGAENSGKLQNLIVIGLFIVLFFFIVRGVLMIEKEYLTPVFPYGHLSVFSTTGLIFVSYLGITQLSAISEEVKNPSKNLPRAFIASVGVVTLLYVGVMLIINGLIPLENLVVLTTPLVEAADMMAGSPGQYVIILAGFFATVSTANAAILSSSRFPFAMGRDELMPQWLIDIHSEYGTPYKAIVATGIVMLLLLFLFEVENLAKLGSAFNVLIFVLINISAIILRKVKQDWYQPSFKDPFFPISQIVGILGSLMLIFQLGVLPLMFALVVMVIGALWYKSYGAGKALPQYNLLDIIDESEIPASVSEVSKKVLVPVSNPDHEDDLLHLAGHLADQVVGLNVVKVPKQTTLSAAQEAYAEEKIQTHHHLKDRFSRKIKDINAEGKYIISFDHDVVNSILSQIDRNSVNLTIMGWQRLNRFSYAIGSLTGKIITQAKSHVAVLKGHFPAMIEKISVAYDGGDNSTYGLYLAKRLAFDAGAELNILRVVDPDLSQEEKEEIVAELERISDVEEGYQLNYEVKERYSVTDTILEASKEADLTIMGDSNRRFKRALTGATSQQVAKHINNPLLVVRMYKPLSSEGLKAFLNKFK